LRRNGRPKRIIHVERSSFGLQTSQRVDFSILDPVKEQMLTSPCA
jgi:hypothetical protein